MDKQQDSQELYGALFRTVTKHFPDAPMIQRTDLVMALYQSVHKWATGEADEQYGVSADVVQLELDI